MTHLLLNKSRIYRAGSDEALYRGNVLFDMMRELACLARAYGQKAREDMASAMAGDLEKAQFYAFFAGVNARRAFTVAAKVLALNKERQEVDGADIDFRRWA